MIVHQRPSESYRSSSSFRRQRQVRAHACVPWPGALSTRNWPPRLSTRSRIPLEAQMILRGASGWPASKPGPWSSPPRADRRPSQRTTTRCPCAARVAVGVGQRLLHQPVERDLHRQRRRAPPGTPARRDPRCPCAARARCTTRLTISASVQRLHRRQAQPAGDGADLVHRPAQRALDHLQVVGGPGRPLAVRRARRGAAWRQSPCTWSSRSSARPRSWAGPSCSSALTRRRKRSFSAVVRAAARRTRSFSSSFCASSVGQRAAPARSAPSAGG